MKGLPKKLVKPYGWIIHTKKLGRGSAEEVRVSVLYPHMKLKK